MAISTRLRAPILVSRLATWVLAVVRPMKRSAAISALVRPRATSSSTSSSRSVSGSFGWVRRFDGSLAAKVDSSRLVMLGAIRAFARGGGMHGLDEQLRPGVLEQKASGAGPERAVDVLVEVEGRDHPHRHGVRDAPPGEELCH